MQTTSDEVLIARIAGGDRLAMQVLFARHHVRVYRFVLRLVRNEATAEDLISEVFLDIWRQAGRFEGRSAVSTWMLSIARFKALSVLRSRPEAELDEETAERIEDHLIEPRFPSLLHGDLLTGNVLVREGRIAGFVDPAISAVTPRSSSLSPRCSGRSGRPSSRPTRASCR